VTRKTDPVTTYANRVVAGRIVSGRLHRLACERHIADLKRATTKRFPYEFDLEKALRPINFCLELKHTKGRTAGEPFIHAPWQAFKTGSLFGWVHKDTGLRRFSTGYVEVGKKNGKTFWSACLALYLAFFEGEPGAEVYSAATSAKQAKNVWEQARQIIESVPELAARIDVYVGNQHNLSNKATFSKFEMLASDYGRRDGIFPSGGIVDELHEHKNRGIWDIVKKSSIGREQPMIIATTTAGFDRHSFCWDQRAYSINILERHLIDEEWFAFIATADEGDDWKSPKTWKKANPNMGVTFTEAAFRGEFNRAQSNPREENSFKRYNLNIWTEQATRWMPLDWWDACDAGRRRLDQLGGSIGFAGLDLAISRDLTALILVVPEGSSFLDVYSWFWCPESDIEARTQTDKVPYAQWVRDGHLIATPGDVTDFEFIEDHIAALFPRLNLRFGSLCFDPQYANYLATRLTNKRGLDEEKVISVAAHFGNLSEPTNYVERIFKNREVRHGDHPILKWCYQNASVKTRDEDPATGASQMMIDKKRSSEKVDGMVALSLAVFGMLKHRQAAERPSIYEGRGAYVLG
jgi:phage terminase large subunit-like protein